MKRCPQCDAELRDEARFCMACGEAQEGAPGGTTSASVRGSGAIAQGDQAVSANQDSVAVGQNVGGHVIVAQGNVTVVDGGELPVDTSAVADQDSALARYLRHVISRNRYLRLQGIRSGGKLVSVELEQLYITLRATRQRTYLYPHPLFSKGYSQ